MHWPKAEGRGLVDVDFGRRSCTEFIKKAYWSRSSTCSQFSLSGERMERLWSAYIKATGKVVLCQKRRSKEASHGVVCGSKQILVYGMHKKKQNLKTQGTCEGTR